jgi:hypothetical protein
VARVQGRGENNRWTYAFHLADREFILPTTVGFTPYGYKPQLRSSMPVDKPRRIFTQAQQLGIARHWMDEALFGDKPANSTLEAAA